MLEVVILHIVVSEFVLFMKCCWIIVVHIALLCQGLQFILVPPIRILNHWRGSPVVDEWHGKVLQIEEMIVSNKYYIADGIIAILIY